MRSPLRVSFGSSLVLCLGIACQGQVGDGGAGSGASGSGASGSGSSGSGSGSSSGNGGSASLPPPSMDNVFFATAVRRLTKSELRNSIADLTGLDLSEELAKFPEDFAEAGDVFAFDNKYTHQAPSAALVAAAKNLADVIGERVLQDAGVRERILPCTPSGAGDRECLGTFVRRFGRRVLRRPLEASEVNEYVDAFAPFSEESGDFARGASLVARVLFQDPEFLYRNEIGRPVSGAPDLVKLTGAEVATRLSFLLWSTTPDDGLLDAAEKNGLETPAAVRAEAERMLADPRARAGVRRFFALWLGYERQPPPMLSAAMAKETAALVERVVFQEKRPWLDLFRWPETYVDQALAAHYGLPAPAGGEGWVPYGDSGRRGILGHGSFLGVERKHADTSPTMRGHFIRTRLLCQTIPPPPPELNVDVDAIPTEGTCKSDRYDMWKRDGCRGCHELLDPIGHGLENFDQLGRFRESAPDDAGKDCTISGAGALAGEGGTFSGAAELADKLAESDTLGVCLGTQLGSYFLGRTPRPDEQAVLSRVAGAINAGGGRFDQMLLDLVSLPGFGYRGLE